MFPYKIQTLKILFRFNAKIQNFLELNKYLHEDLIPLGRVLMMTINWCEYIPALQLLYSMYITRPLMFYMYFRNTFIT